MHKTYGKTGWLMPVLTRTNPDIRIGHALPILTLAERALSSQDRCTSRSFLIQALRRRDSSDLQQFYFTSIRTSVTAPEQKLNRMRDIVV